MHEPATRSRFPDAFLPDLAMGLNNLGITPRQLGRREDVLAVVIEAVSLYQKLVEDRPAPYLQNFFNSVNTLADILQERKISMESEPVMNSAMELLKRLAHKSGSVEEAEQASTVPKDRDNTR